MLRLALEQPKKLFAPLPTLLLWMLVMIAVPIVGWVFGQDAMRQMIIAGVLFQSVAVIAILKTGWSWARLLTVLGFVTAVTLLVEVIGTATGYPFGEYTYTEFLQPQLFHVPLLIPLAWFMMIPAAWAVVQRFYPHRVRFAVMAGLAFTAWDLFLDPQMVAWDFWVWHQPGAYFGIPLLNYAGWFATAFAISWVLHPVARIESPDLRRLLWLVYAITWFLEAFGLAFFWGQLGPALVGGVVMGYFMVKGWRA